MPQPITPVVDQPKSVLEAGKTGPAASLIDPTQQLNKEMQALGQLTGEASSIATTGSALPGAPVAQPGVAGTAPGGLPFDPNARAAQNHALLQDLATKNPESMNHPEDIRAVIQTNDQKEAGVDASVDPQKANDLKLAGSLVDTAATALGGDTTPGKSYADTFNDLMSKDTYGGMTMTDLDKQLTDIKNAEASAATDVRGELTAAGGLVTNSAVAEAAARRNAVIDVAAQRLQNLKTLKQDYIDQQANLKKMDADAAAAKFDQGIKAAETALDLRRPYQAADQATKQSILDLATKYPDAGIDPTRDSALDAANKVKASTSFNIELLAKTRQAQGTLTPDQQFTAARALANEMVNEGLYDSIDQALPAALKQVQDFAAGGGTGAFTPGGSTPPPGGFRTDRNNNPTAMTTDVAASLGLVQGKDYVAGDPFQGGVTAHLIGDPVAVTIKALDSAANDPNKQAFYTAAGQPRWTHTAMSDRAWLAMSPAEKQATVAQMYQKEGGSGDLVAPTDVNAQGQTIDLTDKPTYSSLTQADRVAAQKLADYSIDLKAIPGFGTKSKRTRMIAAATELNPDFNEADYTTRFNLKKSYTSGKDFQNIKSLNTAVGHLATLKAAADKLGNRGFKTWNTISNWVKSETGNPEVSNFNVALNAVAGEMSNIFKSSGGTDTEIQSWKNSINSSSSPAQLQGAISTMVDLMDSRIKALSDQYESVTGSPAPFQIVTPDSVKILDTFGYKPPDNALGTPGTTPAASADQTGSYTSPSGNTYQLPY